MNNINKQLCGTCKFCLYDHKINGYACYNEDSPNFYTGVDNMNFVCDDYVSHNYKQSLFDALETMYEIESSYPIMKDNENNTPGIFITFESNEKLQNWRDARVALLAKYLKMKEEIDNE